MSLFKSFANITFIVLAIAGILLFFMVNRLENTQARISIGKQAQLAIQILDKMRQPILAIEKTQYLETNPQEKLLLFNQNITTAKVILQQYLTVAQFNSELLGYVNQLSVSIHGWLELEQKLWDEPLTSTKSTEDGKDHDTLLSFKSQTIELSFKAQSQFFAVLDILALGEIPLHNDIDDGFNASNFYTWSAALLIIYLFIIIIIHQYIRNIELKDHKQTLEKKVHERTTELESTNHELEAFSYSVSHDLRAPLRAIDGFSQALLEDCSKDLDTTGKDYLNRVRSASQKMAQLIDDLLLLSRVSRNQMNKQTLDMSQIAKIIVNDLQKTDPERKVEINIAEHLTANGDKALITIALTNMLSNAWKYTSKNPRSFIEFARDDTLGEFYIKDNGVGFDMQYAGKLFTAFQRLHGSEFKGTGIGLATVRRILRRHNGDIRVEAKPNKGSCFYFVI